MMCLKVKEGEYPPPPDSSDRPGIFFAVKSYFKDGFGKPYYLWYFAATILAGVSGLPFNLYSVFYAKSLGLEMDIYFKSLALTYVFSLILAYPLGSLADRFHPLRISLGALAAYAIAMSVGGSLVKDSSTYAIALVVHGVIQGCLNTGIASLGQRLLPRDKFAEIGSAGGILNSIINILLPPVMGVFLDATHHEYRYTFFASAILSLLGLIAFIKLHSLFMALGGSRSYVAP